MLTTVILDGPMGKAFGKKWSLSVNSPREALALIDANKPGLFGWIKRNLEKYKSYRVHVEYEDGRKEDLSTEEYQADRKAKLIRFTPIIQGASNGWVKTVVGIVLIVIGFALSFTPAAAASSYFYAAGIAMIAGGVAQLLGPKPKGKEDSDSKTSHYFNGAANTAEQGVPVPLIYGRTMVGSAMISANLTVDQLL